MKLAQPKFFQEMCGTRSPIAVEHALCSRSERDVVPEREPREQRGLLKANAAIRTGACSFTPVYSARLPPVGWLREAVGYNISG